MAHDSTTKQRPRQKQSYGASPIKRERRSKAAIQAIRDAMRTVLQAERPMTVRQVYYRMVSAQVIDKTEAQYDTVCRLLTAMRRDREIPYGWLADATRWQRKPRTFSSLPEMLENSQRFYRRAIWDSQKVYVEVWLEKDALSGVLFDVTAEWDVPLMVTRGYPSLSFLHSAAAEIANQDKPCHLYYFGDHDPSGIDIPRRVLKELQGFAPDAEIHFERVAVTRHQIEDYNLTTRPTKKSDSRSKSFVGESVEVDAIPPNNLRDLVRKCITQHIDHGEHIRLQRVEKAERETLQAIARDYSSGDNE